MVFYLFLYSSFGAEWFVSTRTTNDATILQINSQTLINWIVKQGGKIYRLSNTFNELFSSHFVGFLKKRITKILLDLKFYFYFAVVLFHFLFSFFPFLSIVYMNTSDQSTDSNRFASLKAHKHWSKINHTSMCNNALVARKSLWWWPEGRFLLKSY